MRRMRNKKLQHNPKGCDEPIQIQTNKLQYNPNKYPPKFNLTYPRGATRNSINHNPHLHSSSTLILQNRDKKGAQVECKNSTCKLNNK